MPNNPISNGITVDSLAVDPNLHNNNATASTVKECFADLRVFKTAKPDSVVEIGHPLVYTLIVENMGPNRATGVRLIDDMLTNGRVQITKINSDVLGFRPGASCNVDVSSGPVTVDVRKMIICQPGTPITVRARRVLAWRITTWH